MNNASNNSWTKLRSGLGASLQWWLIVAAAGFLFGGAVAVRDYFYATDQLYMWGAGLPFYMRQIPALLAILMGLGIMGLYMVAVAITFALYRAGRSVFGRRSDALAAPGESLVKN